MGSTSSKNAASSSAVQRTRSKGTNVFQNSCLGRSSISYDSDNDNKVSDNQNKDHGSNETWSVHSGLESDQGKHESCEKFKAQQGNETLRICPNVELDEWGQESVTGSSSSIRATSSRSLNSSSRFCSPFSLIPGNLSFRLSRASSLGSSRAYPPFSTSPPISNREVEFHVNTGPTSSFVNRNQILPGSNLLQACRINRSSAPRDENTSALSGHLQSSEIVSSQETTRNSENAGIGADVNEQSSVDHRETENTETRRPNRRIGAREPAERTVRFSRTLSVGRLRDRVLRRSSFTEGLFGRLEEDREVRDSNQSSGGPVLGGVINTPTSHGDTDISLTPSSYPPSSISSSRYTNQDYEVETLRSRENRYHNIMERRTDFLERRRRIRSQVRALQRLGNRFENLSGHERSCILSGQHRTGHCICRMSNRVNPDDDTNARAGMSRIVMLAEALFEVLDEIHQQSVVLSSQPSVSSIGSVPAPKEVVESMPLKIYLKSQKHQIEEAAQCYICLVEYEEGDCMRVLPCHHEFHQSCIDKWLKEIHRVCPLCRGDVCRSESSTLPPLEN